MSDEDGTPNWVMRVKQWHWGKLLILWIVVPIVMLAVFVAGDLLDAEGFFFFLLAVPIIVMLVITWIWLTGKESR